VYDQQMRGRSGVEDEQLVTKDIESATDTMGFRIVLVKDSGLIS
jgi:hypothetical protein